MTTDMQREEDIALSIDHALTAAMITWCKRYGHLATAPYMSTVVGAVLGFAAKEAASARGAAPLRASFIEEATQVFRMALLEACEMLDAKEPSHGD